MSRNESRMVQGIAILLMLFLHLFNYPDRYVAFCPDMIWVGSHPLVEILSRAANPVSFFLVLSGYGLNYVYRRGNLTFSGQARRLLRLYLFYWLTLLVFVSIGAYLKPDKYPLSFLSCLLNMACYYSTYNAETWFLLPYALISLTAVWIWKVRDRIGTIWMLGITCVLSYLFSFLIHKYGASFLDDYSYHHFYLLIQYLQFTFPFVVGGWLCDVSERRGSLQFVKKSKKSQWLLLLLLLFFTAVKCLSYTSALQIFYTLSVILIFLNFRRPKWLDEFLLRIGKNSTIMWFVHTYFCVYLFKDFIYGFRYPVLIFLVLIVCSYLVAVLLRPVGERVIKWLHL